MGDGELGPTNREIVKIPDPPFFDRLGEESTLGKIFGKDVPVPETPQSLFHDANRLKEFGRDFEVHYWPGHKFQETDLSGISYGPDKDAVRNFFQMIKIGNLSKSAAEFPEGWYIFDTSQPDSVADFLSDPLKRYWENKGGHNWGSRRGVVNTDIEQLLKEFGERVGLEGNIRNRRFIESVALLNLSRHYAQGTGSKEFFADTTPSGSYMGKGRYLVGGGQFGLEIEPPGTGKGEIGFSTIIEYPGNATHNFLGKLVGRK